MERKIKNIEIKEENNPDNFFLKLRATKSGQYSNTYLNRESAKALYDKLGILFGINIEPNNIEKRIGL